MEDFQKSFLSEMDLQADEQAKTQLLQAAKWSRFISITMFVFAGFILIAGILGGALFAGTLQRLGTSFDTLLGYGGPIIMIIGVIAAAIFAVMYYFLFSFSGKVKKGVLYEDTAEFNGSLKMLKTFFIITTVFAIIAVLLSIVNLLQTL